MSRYFQNCKAVLIDLSGTLHIDNFAIADAQNALEKLRQKRIKLKFVTNTSKENLNSLYNRLKKLNFNISKDEIYSSLSASKQFIKCSNLRPYLMLSDSAKQDFADINQEEPNAILVGLSPEHFQYEELTYALRLLLQGAKLIAINKARYIKRPDGLALGAGAFIKALEYASGVDSTVVGKPEEKFFLEAASLLGCSPADCVMIGDDARDDIEGALKAGMKGVLVQTGKYLDGDERNISLDGYRVAPDFPTAVELIMTE